VRRDFATVIRADRAVLLLLALALVVGCDYGANHIEFWDETKITSLLRPSVSGYGSLSAAGAPGERLMFSKIQVSG
jgi:hypothetical protein